jgi:hypothetical protein
MGRKGISTTMLPDRYLKNPCEDLTAEEFNRAKTAHDDRQNARRHSTGPTSPEGKAKSAQNARRHGYAGATVVVAEEDCEAYNLHLDSYLQTFNPVTQPECDSIRRAAYAQWRYDRLISIETGLLDLDLSLEGPTMDSKVHGELEHHHRLALAFLSQVGTNGSSSPLELCRRYLTTAQRDIERSIKFFYFLQKNRIVPAQAAVPGPLPSDSESSAQPEQPQQNQMKPNELVPITSNQVQIVEQPLAKFEDNDANTRVSNLKQPKAA